MSGLELIEPRLCKGVVIEREGPSIQVLWPDNCLSFASCGSSQKELINQLATEPLPPELSNLVPALFAQGLLFDAGRPNGPDFWHGLNLVGPILKQIRCTAASAFPEGGLIDRLISGTAPRATVVDWLYSMFHFTDSACRHIGPLLEVGDAIEAQMWQNLYSEEIEHWRIYRRIFAELGTTIHEVRRSPPYPAAIAFVDWLEHLARNAPHAYAASLLFIEQPPIALEMLDDPLYRALHKHYGFSVAAVRPLWLHAVANGTAGHASLGSRVLARRGIFVGAEVEEILAMVAKTVESLGALYEVLGDLRQPNLESMPDMP